MNPTGLELDLDGFTDAELAVAVILFEGIAKPEFPGRCFFAGVAAALKSEALTRALLPGTILPPAVVPTRDLASLPAGLFDPLLTFLRGAATSWSEARPEVAMLFRRIAVALAEAGSEPSEVHLPPEAGAASLDGGRRRLTAAPQGDSSA